MQPWNRCPTSCSATSPISCPKVSLTALKPSRSIMSTANTVPWRARVPHGLMQAIGEQGAVRQSGERIGVCEIGELLPGAMLLGDIPGEARQRWARRRARCIPGSTPDRTADRRLACRCRNIGSVRVRRRRAPRPADRLSASTTMSARGSRSADRRPETSRGRQDWRRRSGRGASRQARSRCCWQQRTERSRIDASRRWDGASLSPLHGSSLCAIQ